MNLPNVSIWPAGGDVRVCFVGAGPGSADLITVRGAQRLAQAQIVLFDALVDEELRAWAPQAEWIHVGKRGFCESTAQARINALLVQAAGRHARVVRLKGGDPSIFGRLEEEIEALQQAGIGFEVVPGVTSALAAAAATGRPLTRRGRGRSVSLTTAMTRQGELHVNRQADTEVFYMAGRQLATLQRQLLAQGWSPQTAVQVVSRAGWADQLASSHPLEELHHATVLHSGRPTVVCVGVGAETIAGQAPQVRKAAHPPVETALPMADEVNPVHAKTSRATSTEPAL